MSERNSKTQSEIRVRDEGILTELVMKPFNMSKDYYILRQRSMTELEKMELTDKALLYVANDSLKGLGFSFLMYSLRFSKISCYLVFGFFVGKSFRKVNNLILNNYSA